MTQQKLFVLLFLVGCIAAVYSSSSCGEKELIEEGIPLWNETLFWPYNLGNKTVVTYNSEGYVMYTGQNEAEICPPSHKKACCPCGRSSCDQHHASGCARGRRPCEDKYFCDLVAAKNSVAPKPVVPQKKPDYQFEPMTRNNILQRAVGWIAHSFPYANDGVGVCNFETCGQSDTNNGCPSKRYQSVCNGLVAMAWRVDNETPDNATSYCVDCHKLLPGDGIHLEKHWIMFLDWEDGYQKAKVWQVGGGKGKANQAYFYIKDLHFCRRRRSIIGENITDEVPCNDSGLENVEINKYNVD